MNLQQLTDAVNELQGQAAKANENAVAFLVSQVQPLATQIKDLQDRVAALEATVKTIEGTPAKP